MHAVMVCGMGTCHDELIAERREEEGQVGRFPRHREAAPAGWPWSACSAVQRGAPYLQLALLLQLLTNTLRLVPVICAGGSTAQCTMQRVRTTTD